METWCYRPVKITEKHEEKGRPAIVGIANAKAGPLGNQQH